MAWSTPGLPVHQLPEFTQTCPLSQWCHPTISSSVGPFSSRLQSFPASGSFQMSQFFALCGQSIGEYTLKEADERRCFPKRLRSVSSSFVYFVSNFIWYPLWQINTVSYTRYNTRSVFYFQVLESTSLYLHVIIISETTALGRSS